MLISFKTKNFKSFKKLATLNLIKGKTRQHEERIAHVENVDVLKFSAVFGANASGKSNLVRALKVMQFIIFNGGKLPGDAINEYFKLDDTARNTPTYFETIISISHKVYSYGFEIILSNGVIVSEWLTELHKKSDGSIREKNLFSRDNDNIDCAALTSKAPKIIQNRLLVYKDDIAHNPYELFLTKVSKNMLPLNVSDENVNQLINVYLWYHKQLKVVYPNTSLLTPEIIFSSIDKLTNILRAFDTGITKIENIPMDENDFFQESIQSGLDPIAIRQLIEMASLNNKKSKFMLRLMTSLWLIEKKDNRQIYSKLTFLHDDNAKHIFNVGNESDGTMRLFDIAEPLTTTDKDTVFVIDELDRCLHPGLTIQYINSFLSKAKDNSNNNQLIVTTHESRLLNLDLVRRDEIWFTEKENNESTLYSLNEYNVRFDNVIDKAYMEGRYGGVPIFDKLYLSNLTDNEN